MAARTVHRHLVRVIRGLARNLLQSPIFVLDVSVDGKSTAGHEFGTGLSEEERRDLVEYLKTL